ncbi:MAG: hypothetical protein HOY79_33680 [Streptomyces sp.]|nr:hypothetical protein [Streptomyces sp.]NUS11356.1 hypothetical protein [Streptomyces sp.]NUS23503.1 hypothetical protein [Streptomyces sp.]
MSTIVEVDEASGCDGKIPYTEMSEALDALRRQRRRQPGARALDIYGCRFCGRLHIGNTARAATRPRAVPAPPAPDWDPHTTALVARITKHPRRTTAA